MKTVKVKKEVSDIIDREKDIKYLCTKIIENSNTTVHFLHAKTAIGKSSLTTKLANKVAFFKDTIIIRTPPNNLKESNEWIYVDEIFEKISEYYKLTDFSFENFIVSIKNEAIRRNIIETFINTAKNTSFIEAVTWTSIERVFKLGKFSPMQLVAENNFNTRRIKSNYLEYILDNKECLIILDNLQNIDYFSLKSIIEIINSTQNSNNYFIFEYTLTENNSYEKLLSLMDMFPCNGVNVLSSEVDKLPSEYAVDIINHTLDNKPLDMDFNTDVKNYFESEGSGNLRQLIDYALNYDKLKHCIKYHVSPTLENLVGLSENSKLLLSAIIMNGGKIHISIIDNIFYNIDIHKKIAKELNDHYLIVLNDSYYYLSHASISDMWHKYSDKFEIIDSETYSKLEPIYLDILKYPEAQYVTSDYALLSLLKLYSTFDPSKISSLIKKLKDMILFNITPLKAWNYLSIFIEFTKQNPEYYLNVYFDILCICFELELYNEGFECIYILKKNQIQSDLLILYESMYLSALDKHPMNIKFCNENENILKTERGRFCLQLISLSSYRSIGDNESCISLFLKLRDNKYKKYLEYGYLLRLTDMFLPKDECLNYVEDSVDFFNNKNMKHQVGKSLITLSYVLSGLGKTDLALEKVKLAEQYLKDKRMGEHMFLVNKAAIMLLQGNYSKEVLEYLNRAEFSATVPFDKLAIYINQIVWCIENPDKAHIANLIIKNAERLLNEEPDLHIHALLYYDLYVYYKNDPNENMKSKYYYNKAKEIMQYCLPVRDRILNKEHVSTKFILTKKWHICYLSYWTFDILINQDDI